ncbi:MAG: hypothetical protein ACRBDI_10320 [Alphaproteobacteria bacterium]
MCIHKIALRNCISGVFSKKLFLGVCGGSLLFLSSCVETFEFPNMDVFKPVSQENSEWNSSVPPDLSEDKIKASKEYGRDVPDGKIIYKKIKSEKLLQEEGVWNLVEQSKSYDPAQAHLEARQNVDIKRRQYDDKLAAHFKPDAKSGQDGKLRVLRLDSGKGGYHDIYKDVEVAESSVVKPSNTVVGHEVLEKITSIFGEQMPLLEHDIVPLRKPLRQSEESKDSAFNGAGVDVSGVVKPPALPDWKKKRQLVVTGEQSEGDSVPVPPIKPVASKRSDKNPVIENGVLPDGFSIVNGIRAAVHDGKVRLVVEVKNATRYKTAVDHLRNVLRIKLDKARWNINPQGSLSKSNGLFGSYVAKEQSDGSVMLEIRLKRKAQIVDTMILRPNVSPHHRIVIDLKK